MGDPDVSILDWTVLEFLVTAFLLSLLIGSAFLFFRIKAWYQKDLQLKYNPHKVGNNDNKIFILETLCSGVLLLCWLGIAKALFG